MALRERGLVRDVCVWSPSASTRAACKSAPWCNEVQESPEAACEGAHLVVLCGPVDRIPPLLEKIAPVCEDGCLVTDVGSTKERICASAAQIFGADHPATFVGSHPMAGSEKSGLAHADPDLFCGKTCILTPTENVSESAFEWVKMLWESLEMRTVRCSPVEHDRIVGRVSHLPHIVAAALAATLADGSSLERESSGAGLRDTTRIAAGDPALWESILMENRNAVRKALEQFEAELQSFRSALDSNGEDLQLFLRKAGDYRLSLDEKATET